MTISAEEFRAGVRGALDEVICAHADTWERNRGIDRAGWQELARRGLLTAAHSGAEFLRSAILLDELGRTGYAGVRAAVGVHAFMALRYLSLFGPARLQEAYIPDARAGARIAALALTEEGAGTDLGGLSTQAEQLPDGRYLVNGVKVYVANGSQADFFVTLARTRPAVTTRTLAGASLMVIDGDQAGLRRERTELLGWHSADVCRIHFEDVMVAPDHVLGRPHQALPQLMRALDFERLVAGLLALGSVAYSLDLLTTFVRHHQVRATPLDSRQVVQHKVADLYADFEMLQQYGAHATRLHSTGELDTRTACVLKLKSTELAAEAARSCVQFHGARGYTADSPAARVYRDAAAATIAAGPSELLRDMIYETVRRPLPDLPLAGKGVDAMPPGGPGGS